MDDVIFQVSDNVETLSFYEMHVKIMPIKQLHPGREVSHFDAC